MFRRRRSELLRDDPPELVHLVQTAAYQGRVQPGAAAAAAGRTAGVPVWIDAAQAVGHVASQVGATAVYGTSRKWLRGPRGRDMSFSWGTQLQRKGGPDRDRVGGAVKLRRLAMRADEYGVPRPALTAPRARRARTR